MTLTKLIAAMSVMLSAFAVQAEIRVGIVLATTGAAASAGISQQKVVPLLPTKVGNETVTYIVLDDAADPTRAAQNARRLVTENRVDVLIASTTSPGAIAVSQVAGELKTPMLALSPIPLTAESFPWVFVMTQSNQLMAEAVVDDMKRKGVKTAAFIGYTDAFGEAWLQALNTLGPKAGITVVDAERFARTDTTVLSQVLRLSTFSPDAVLVGASTTLAGMPQRTLRERGYKGLIYHTHGSAAAEFLQAAGADGKDALVPAPAVMVAEQLPAGYPTGRQAAEFVKAYEGANGAQTRTVFSAILWDAGKFLASVVPSAMSVAKPGTPEFRSTLRDRFEQAKDFPAANGLITYSKDNHSGFQKKSVVLMRVVDGKWQVEK